MPSNRPDCAGERFAHLFGEERGAGAPRTDSSASSNSQWPRQTSNEGRISWRGSVRERCARRGTRGKRYH
jgi:hypothetical protein